MAERWIGGRALSPETGAFGFLLAVTYWPGISGAATSPRWALLCVLPFVLLVGPNLKITLAHVAGILFVMWALATASWSLAPLNTVDAGFKLILLASAFCVGGLLPSRKPLVIGAGFGLGVSSLLGLAQLSGHLILPDVTAAAGLFVNPLMLAEASALVFAAALAEGVYWALIPVLPGLLLHGSRGAMLAAGLSLIAWTWPRSKSASATIFGLLLLAIGTVYSVRGTESTLNRFAVWQANIAVISWTGNGLGSYWDTAPQPQANTHYEHAHNEFLESAVETGVIGAVLVCGFFAVLGVFAFDLVWLALVVEMTTAFPLHEPFSGAFGLLCAGYAARRLRGAGDTAHAGGILLRRWLAAGARFRPFRRRAGKSVSVLPLRSPLPKRPDAAPAGPAKTTLKSFDPCKYDWA